MTISKKVKMLHPRHNTKWRCTRCLSFYTDGEDTENPRMICQEGYFNEPYDMKLARRMNCRQFLYRTSERE